MFTRLSQLTGLIMLLSSGGCSRSHLPGSMAFISPGADDNARTILQDAMEAMGGMQAVGGIDSLYASCDCSSPRGLYRMIVHCRAPDEVFFDQIDSTGRQNKWIVTGDDAWGVDESGSVTGDLGSVQISIARGHAYHMFALNPSLRFEGGQGVEPVEFDGRDCDALAFIDTYGKPLTIYYDQTTHLPAGFTMIEPMSDDDASITSTFDDWRTVGALTLFHRVRTTHRGDVYECVYTQIRFNTVDESIFQRGPW